MDGSLIIIIIFNNEKWVTTLITITTHSPMNVTLDGIVTELNNVENPFILNIWTPITVSPDMSNISEREEQAANEPSPKIIIISELEEEKQ